MSGSKGAATNYYPPDASFGPSRLASTLELGPLLTAVPCARLHAKLILKEWNLADVADDAELIISELMTNALKAARPLPEIQPITLHLQASHDHLMIHVWDALSAAPAPRPHAIDAETGRGLEIVSLLSERWGFYHPVGGGKVIWATLKISATPAPLPERPAHERTHPPAKGSHQPPCLRPAPPENPRPAGGLNISQNSEK